MEQWEIPSCSICYERLLTDLSLLPNCGHVYHSHCLKTWLDKIGSKSPNCPLCRKYTNLNNVISLKYSINKSETDSTVSEVPTDDDTTSVDYNSNEKEVLEDRILNEINNKELLVNEIKDLKFNNERNKTTIQGLSNKLIDLKEKLKNLDSNNNNDPSDIKSFLTAFSGDEKINFLLNRISVLESMVNELNDMNQKIRSERDQMEINYKTTRREFINLYNFYNPRQSDDKLKLPGLDNQDFLVDNYENRRKLSKAVSKLKDDIVNLSSYTPDRLNASSNSFRTMVSTPDGLRNARSSLGFLSSDRTPDRFNKNTPSSNANTYLNSSLNLSLSSSSYCSSSLNINSTFNMNSSLNLTGNMDLNTSNSNSASSNTNTNTYINTGTNYKKYKESNNTNTKMNKNSSNYNTTTRNDSVNYQNTNADSNLKSNINNNANNDGNTINNTNESDNNTICNNNNKDNSSNLNNNSNNSNSNSNNDNTNTNSTKTSTNTTPIRVNSKEDSIANLDKPEDVVSESKQTQTKRPRKYSKHKVEQLSENRNVKIHTFFKPIRD